MEKKKGEIKIINNEKPNDPSHFLVHSLTQNFDLYPYPSKNVKKDDASKRKTCCLVTNAFFSSYLDYEFYSLHLTSITWLKNENLGGLDVSKGH